MAVSASSARLTNQFYFLVRKLYLSSVWLYIVYIHNVCMIFFRA